MSCAEMSIMKNIIFSAKFTLTLLGITLVNLRGREHKLPRDGMFEPLHSVNSYHFHS